jgi:hypothetical protein
MMGSFSAGMMIFINLEVIKKGEAFASPLL